MREIVFVFILILSACNTYDLKIAPPSSLPAGKWSSMTIDIGDANRRSACLRLSTQTGKLSCRNAYCWPLDPAYDGATSQQIYLSVPKTEKARVYAAYQPSSDGTDVITADVFESDACRPSVNGVSATAARTLPPDMAQSGNRN
jgi:hypothetical protein